MSPGGRSHSLDAMDDTRESKEDGDNEESMEDAMAAAMAESMGQAAEQTQSDPSALLASAAESLKEIDDPAFDGPPQEKGHQLTANNHPGGANHRSEYGRAVLSIETPVAVVLAKHQISVERVVNLVPGSMLTFDAHCDEPLTLEAGGHAIAVGETVKIGDKFGLRIRQLLHSDE